MAVNPKFCSVCDLRHISKPSTDWCSDCEQALCGECKDVHGLLMSSKTHSVILIADYLALGPSISTTGTYCTEHNEKYQLYCQQHDVSLCLVCLDEHSKCDNIIQISKLIKDVKTSDTFREVQQNIVDIENNISKINNFLQENLNSLEEQKENILSHIQEIRKKIDAHLDSLEESLKDKIFQLHKKLTEEIRLKMKNLQEKRTAVEGSKQQYEKLNKYASEYQVFFGLKELTSDTTTIKQFLQSVSDGDHMEKYILDFQIDDKINSIVSEIESFGLVHQKTESCQMSLEWSVDKKAQFVGSRISDINAISLHPQKTFQIPNSVLSGCDTMPDGKLVLIDRNDDHDFIILTDTKGKEICRTSVKPSYALDVSYINENTVAVTSDKSGHQRINIVDINTQKIIKYITTDGKCYGIAHKDGVLFCCVAGTGIQRINLGDNTVTTIFKCPLSLCSYIASLNDKLFYTDAEKHTITCCNTDGNTIWTFANDAVLEIPGGLTVDNVGNVFVASYGNSSVVVLSSDGQHSRQVLSKDGGLIKPNSLNYDRNTGRLIVACENGTVHMYDVSS